MQNFRALGTPPPEPRASVGWGFAPIPPLAYGGWGLRSQISKTALPPLRISGSAPGLEASLPDPHP